MPLVDRLLKGVSHWANISHRTYSVSAQFALPLGRRIGVTSLSRVKHIETQNRTTLDTCCKKTCTDRLVGYEWLCDLPAANDFRKSADRATPAPRFPPQLATVTSPRAKPRSAEHISPPRRGDLYLQTAFTTEHRPSSDATEYRIESLQTPCPGDCVQGSPTLCSR